MTIMQPTILQILNLRKTAGDVGIEVECEGHGMFFVDSPFWKSEDDGSLRGMFPEERCEYILKKPIPAKNVKAVLSDLSKALAANGAVLDFSYRTSVHVHVNVQELNIDQVMNIAYTYLLLEEPLANFCGKQRKGCQFALRLVDAEGLLDYLGNVFEFGDVAIRNIPKDTIRYSAINFEAIQKYGSIEFRGMRGNLDVELLSQWVDILMNIREFAKKYDNPLALFKVFRSVGAKGFLAMAIGEDNTKVLTYPRIEQEIQRNFSLTIDLPVLFKKLDAKRKAPPPPKIEYFVGQKLSYKEAIAFITEYPGAHACLTATGKLDEDGFSFYKLNEKLLQFITNKLNIEFKKLVPAQWDDFQ